MSIFKKATSVLQKTTTSVFGTTATYKYLESSPDSEIKGVFDNAFIEVNGISTKKPIFKMNLSDLTSEPVDGDKIVIEEIEYMVRDHEPDSFGSTTLILEKL